MWEQVALLALGALVVKFLEPWIDRVKARTSAEYWETQERWRFKADVYSRALAALDRMRQPLDGRGRPWPVARGGRMETLIDASLDLTEAASRAAIWLPDDAVVPLGVRATGCRTPKAPRYREAATARCMRADPDGRQQVDRHRPRGPSATLRSGSRSVVASPGWERNHDRSGNRGWLEGRPGCRTRR